MAFFKFRKGGDEHPTPAQAPESVEAMRTRARHRLIGASVLVVLGVIGFPLLFDSQPRPIAVDIPIEIPDRNTVKPLATTIPIRAGSAVVVDEPDAGKPIDSPKSPLASVSAPSLSTNASPTSRLVAGAVSVAPHPQTVASSKLAPKPEAKADSRHEPKLPEKPTVKVAEKAVEKVPQTTITPKVVTPVDDGAKARALLEGKESPTVSAVAAPLAAVVPAASGRFVVQIGAFSDAAKAQEPRGKLERAGLKTYTQVVQTKDGKRVRVRVGPFDSKAQAEQAAQKIRQLDLQAAILEL